MNKKAYNVSLTGFVVGFILVAMLATTFAIFSTSIQEEYSIEGDHSLGNYNDTNLILTYTEDIRDSTQIDQDQGVLDVIGAYFRNGYTAIQVTMQSFGLFENLMTDASQDLTFMQQFHFKEYLVATLLIMLFIGIVISVLVKMYI